MVGAVASLLAVASRANAADEPNEPTVRLEYTLDPELGACASEQEFRAETRSELGRDPFADSASDQVSVRIDRRERVIEGHLVWTDAQGTSEGERRLRAADGNCRELVRSLSFALALQIRSLVSARRAARAAATTQNSPSSTAHHESLPQEAARASTSPHSATSARANWSLGFGSSVGFGLAPSVNTGGLLFAAVGYRALSLELDLQGYLPARLQRADRSGFSLSALGATLAGCGRIKPLALCPLLAVDRWRVSGFGVDVTRTPASTTAELGLRLAIEPAISQRFLLRARADGLALLTPRTVLLNDTPAWTTPRVALSCGIDAGLFFQ
jgi:hypothetical protein